MFPGFYHQHQQKEYALKQRESELKEKKMALQLKEHELEDEAAKQDEMKLQFENECKLKEMKLRMELDSNQKQHEEIESRLKAEQSRLKMERTKMERERAALNERESRKHKERDTTNKTGLDVVSHNHRSIMNNPSPNLSTFQHNKHLNQLRGQRAKQKQTKQIKADRNVCYTFLFTLCVE